MKDLGQLNFFLGIEAQFHPEGLFLSQERYILDLLKWTNMSNAKPVFINHVLTPLPYSVCSDVLLSRPDLSFAVNRQPLDCSEADRLVPTIHLQYWAPNHPQLLYSTYLLERRLGQLPK